MYTPGAHSPAANWLGCEADHNHQHLVVRLRMHWIVSPLPQYISMAWGLIKQEIHLHGMALS